MTIIIIIKTGGKLVIFCTLVVTYTYIELKLIYILTDLQLIYNSFTCDCIYKSSLCHSLCTAPPAWTANPLLFMSTLSQSLKEMQRSTKVWTIPETINIDISLIYLLPEQTWLWYLSFSQYYCEKLAIYYTSNCLNVMYSDNMKANVIQKAQ